MNIFKQSIELHANERVKQVDNGLFLFAISHTIQYSSSFPGRMHVEKFILIFVCFTLRWDWNYFHHICFFENATTAQCTESNERKLVIIKRAAKSHQKS